MHIVWRHMWQRLPDVVSPFTRARLRPRADPNTCVWSHVPDATQIRTIGRGVPLPYSYTLTAILICMVYVLFYAYHHLFVFFLLFLQIS